MTKVQLTPPRIEGEADGPLFRLCLASLQTYAALASELLELAGIDSREEGWKEAKVAVVARGEMVCGKALLGEGDAALPLWENRIKKLLDADSPDAAIRELLDCIPPA